MKAPRCFCICITHTYNRAVEPKVMLTAIFGSLIDGSIYRSLQWFLRVRLIHDQRCTMTARAFLKRFLLNYSYFSNFKYLKQRMNSSIKKTIFFIIHQQCNGCIYWFNITPTVDRVKKGKASHITGN
jgi:hypothetical protein